MALFFFAFFLLCLKSQGTFSSDLLLVCSLPLFCLPKFSIGLSLDM